MESRDFISSVVADLRPVTPLAVPRVRVTVWALLTAACIAAVVTALGWRRDVFTVAFSTSFQLQSVLLTIAALSSAAVALTASIPGERQPKWMPWTSPLAVLAWIGWLALQLMTSAASVEGQWPLLAGWGCLLKVGALGLAPWLTLGVMIRRGATDDVRGPITFAALAGAAMAALGVALACPINAPMHVIVWHAAPVLIVVAVAWLASMLPTSAGTTGP